MQLGNTGNFNNAPNFLQAGSEADGFEPGVALIAGGLLIRGLFAG